MGELDDFNFLQTVPASPYPLGFQKNLREQFAVAAIHFDPSKWMDRQQPWHQQDADDHDNQ